MAAVVDAAKSYLASFEGVDWYAAAHEYAYNVLTIQADKGFWVTYGQTLLFFYGAVFMIDAIIPVFVNVRSVQKGQPYEGQFWVNLIASNRSLIVKAGYLYLAEVLEPLGCTLLYRQPANSWLHVGYMIFCTIVLDLCYDTFFYFGHRMQHLNKWLYKNVHGMHHRDICPRGLGGASFHVIEALIDYGGEFMLAFILPVNYRLYRGYILVSTITHVGGHGGYEMASVIPLSTGMAMLLFSPLSASSHVNSVLHHDMHHRFPNANFAIYFTHWDRLLKTEHPSYRHQAATSEVRD